METVTVLTSLIVYYRLCVMTRPKYQSGEQSIEQLKSKEFSKNEYIESSFWVG